jgi:hypothetical protein
MLANGIANHNGHVNGNGVNVHRVYPPCPSDYEPVTIDAIPTAPKPGWRDQLAPVTWSMSWTASDVSHSVTLRGDTEQEVLDLVKPLVAGIKAAKEKRQAQNPQTQPEHVVCKIHGAPMERRVSKRTGGHYHCHRLAGNDLCFGREKKA